MVSRLSLTFPAGVYIVVNGTYDRYLYRSFNADHQPVGQVLMIN